jgi:hypothetical protein
MAKNNNTNSTRYYSDAHEKSICKALGAHQQPNSGAAKFSKGDIVHDGASMLIEAKCAMSEKQSVSVKKEWFEKNKVESFAIRKSNQAVCINFGPESDNYYIINERLMKFLVEKLEEENSIS